MFKNKKLTYSLTLIPLIIILGLFVWLFTIIFEGEKPSASLDPLPDFLSKEKQFRVNVHDAKRGLRYLKIFCSQGGRDILISEKKFPFAGFLNRDGIRNFDQEFTIDPTSLHLAQGRVDLNVQVWDYSSSDSTFNRK